MISALLLRQRASRQCGRRVTTYEQSLEKPRRGL
jgi:transcriptional regulator NrdR family protein